MNLQRTSALLLAVMGLNSGMVGAATPPAEDDGRIVVVISVDGLAGYYIDDPNAEMPTIRELAKEGARAVSMKAVTPTVTWPNHTTLVTGDYPARHGVVGNNYYDRTTGKHVQLISDPVFDKDQIVKVPTIYDVAKENGLKTAAIRWPASRNAKSLDWTAPDVPTIALLEKYTTPGLIDDCKKDGINLLEPGDTKEPGQVVPSGPQDEEYTKTFNYILENHRPNLALLHVVNVDHTEHLKGPKSLEAYEAVKEADAQVKEIWDELKKDYPGKATLIVVSDHGFSPIEKAIFPNVVLRDAGLITVKGVRVVAGDVDVVVQGGCAMIYVKDETKRDEIIARVKKAFEGMDGIEKLAGPEDLKAIGVADMKDDPHAPDAILFVKEGYTLGDTAAGALSFREKPERKGSHGHDADIPDLHATFVAWGNGIKPGVKIDEIQNIDVAPTVAKLLHIDFPNTDGKPLDSILAN